jgi:hypothetical protein
MTEPAGDHMGAVLGHSRGGVRGVGADGRTWPDDRRDMCAVLQRDGGGYGMEE